MSVRSHADAVADAEWSDLVGELDRWGQAGHVATLWWRDDDAVGMTPALARLLGLAGPAPLALAVIPAAAERDLAEALRRQPRIAVLQHGWSHANHGGAGKKSEFPADRPVALAAADLAAGRARLTALFGASAAPILAPPWNRLAPECERLLAPAGIKALSALAPRRFPPLYPGLAGLDVHVDLVDWKGTRGFAGRAAALGGIVGELRRRRLGLGLGHADGAAPTGILTHHLVMDDAAADFLAELCALIAGHRGARWSDIREALA